MQNSISYDWINNVPVELGAEGEDIGNGNSSEYGDQPPLPDDKPGIHRARKRDTAG